MKKLLVTIAFAALSAVSARAADTLFVTQPVKPLLVNSKSNVLLELRIKPSANGQTLKTVDLNLGDTKYISEITLYYTGTQNMARGTEFTNPSYSIIKSRIEKFKPQMSLQVDQPLFDANNYFVVGISLTPDAPLTARVAAGITGATVDGQMVAVEMRGATDTRRVGVSVRNAGDDGVAAYRIPGLVKSKKGTLMAVYDIRRNNSRDLQEDVQIGLSRSMDKGKTWQPMQVAMDMRGYGSLPDAQNGVGDPAILVDDKTGDIYIMALWSHGMGGQAAWWGSRKNAMTPQQQAAQVLIVRSSDDGATWSEPINITAQIKDPSWGILLQGPGMGITMEDGTLVFPFQFVDKDDMPHATIVYSKDRGNTWQIGSAARSNTTEAQVAEVTPGKLMLNMRDNRKGSRAVMTTTDMGQTWVEHATSRSALIEPVCMASFIKVDDNRFLFSNPANTKDRRNMTIKGSDDKAESWNGGVLIDDGDMWGYSCMTMVDPENVGILYEGSQAHMTFQIIPLKEIMGK